MRAYADGAKTGTQGTVHEAQKAGPSDRAICPRIRACGGLWERFDLWPHSRMRLCRRGEYGDTRHCPRGPKGGALGQSHMSPHSRMRGALGDVRSLAAFANEALATGGIGG